MTPIAVALTTLAGEPIETPAVLVDVDEGRELGTLVLADRTLVVRALSRLRVLDVRYPDGRDAISVLEVAGEILELERAAREAVPS